jgi:hypothetical protein
MSVNLKTDFKNFQGGQGTTQQKVAGNMMQRMLTG